jgi:hypothetical protein
MTRFGNRIVRGEHDNRENNEVAEFRIAHQYYEIRVVAEICILRSLDCLQPRGMILADDLLTTLCLATSA